ncbi:MAG: type II toxin-antitoxin system VapC family toxin [Chloroflexi bacterium]|nr:type II toxin-antitoxin system VapC family toxin [Chloroflexota bacterium]MBI2983036.1 type II toxin-antitoxin system VapC family toxin [Chloroflexota bacterium]
MDPSLTARPLTLVIDASAASNACLAETGFATYGSEELVAPALLWSEVRSSLREAVWRRELASERALDALAKLERAPIAARKHAGLSVKAWEIADQLGWAKTYDAEYIALAVLLKCRLVTLDDRLRRGTERFGIVIGPADL